MSVSVEGFLLLFYLFESQFLLHVFISQISSWWPGGKDKEFYCVAKCLFSIFFFFFGLVVLRPFLTKFRKDVSGENTINTAVACG